MKKLLIFSLVGAGVFCITLATNGTRSNPRIVFCDVGQGDGIYIRTYGGSDIIIDAGPNRRMTDCLARHMPFFDRDIETAIITHHDRDHDGGLPYIQERYTVKKILDNTSLTAHNRIAADQITLTVLHPTKKKGENSDNNNSLILLLESKNTNVLFLADVDVTISEPILTSYSALPAIHILKVSHHGSRYGTSASLLSLLRPTHALISAGAKNLYGHPHPDTIRKLNQTGIRIIDTRKTGDYEYPL